MCAKTPPTAANVPPPTNVFITSLHAEFKVPASIAASSVIADVVDSIVTACVVGAIVVGSIVAAWVVGAAVVCSIVATWVVGAAVADSVGADCVVGATVLVECVAWFECVLWELCESCVDELHDLNVYCYGLRVLNDFHAHY